MPVPVAIAVPQEFQTTDPTAPVGSPPFENAVGLASPKPLPEGAITSDRPSVGSDAVGVVAVLEAAALVAVVTVDELVLGALDDTDELVEERGELDVHAPVRTDTTLTPIVTANRPFTMTFLLVAHREPVTDSFQRRRLPTDLGRLMEWVA
jgi:hypothetical protein